MLKNKLIFPAHATKQRMFFSLIFLFREEVEFLHGENQTQLNPLFTM